MINTSDLNELAVFMSNVLGSPEAKVRLTVLLQRIRMTGDRNKNSGRLDYSFRWRHYMPYVGRFFNADPLEEKYAYNPTDALAGQKKT